MAKEEASNEIKEIKKSLDTRNLIVGTNATIKNLKLGRTKKIFLSSNCSSATSKEISLLAKKDNITVKTIQYPNDELGIICRKPFAISVLGFK